MKMNKGFRRGLNLGGWISQCNYSDEHIKNFIQYDDLKRIASWDFDHVRIPFDYNIFEDEEKGFSILDKAVSDCSELGLNVVLDLHKTKGFSFDDYGEDEKGFFDSEEYQEYFYRLWEKLAARYGKYHETVAFELLNEITSKEYITMWNRIAKTAIVRIRKYAPHTFILVGSYENNSVTTVDALENPYDKNVVYNFHFYEPLVFTHQGAYWTDRIDPEKRMSYSESGCCEQYFEDMFIPAVKKAEKDGLKLYCGEFGMIDRVGSDDALKWFEGIGKVFDKYGIGHCAWTYKGMDFSILERQEILEYI